MMKPIVSVLLLLPMFLSACQPPSPTVVVPILPSAEPTNTATTVLPSTETAVPTQTIAPTLTPTVPVPTATLPPTATPATGFSRYTSDRYGVSFDYPSAWKQAGEDAFAGEEGSVRIEPYETDANYFSRACDWEANLHPEKYGLRPQLVPNSWAPEYVIGSCALIPAPDSMEETVQVFFRSYTMNEEPTIAVLMVDSEDAEHIRQSFQIVLPPNDEIKDPEPGLRLGPADLEDIAPSGPETQVVHGLTFNTWRGPREKLLEMRLAWDNDTQIVNDAAALAGYNEALAPLGYRLEEVSYVGGPAYDLYQGDRLVEDYLTPPYWPITTSENDFAMVTNDLNANKPDGFIFRTSDTESRMVYDFDLHFWMPPVFAGDKLATVEKEMDGSTTRALVKLEGVPVYTFSSSMYDYERTLVRSFGAWDGQWVMNANNTLIVDGENINVKLGYGEVFDWQIFEGSPWFFFEKDGRYGISYGGEEVPITWEHIPHLECCGGWHNPTGPGLWGRRDTITFFGWEDGAYSLVEVTK